MGILLATLVVVSLVPAGTAGQVANESTAIQQDEFEQSDGEIDTADEIYVREDGDAVLVYDTEDTASTSEATGQLGLDVSENLMYMLVTEPTTGTTDADGQAQLTLTDDELAGNGSLSVARPRSLQSLSEFSMELTGQSTAQDAASSLTVDAAIDTSDMRVNQLFESVTTTGNITTTSSQFTANGNFNADLVPVGMTGGSQASSLSFALSESDGGYTVDVDRNETVFAFGESDWETRETALQTLEEQYQLTAEDLEGSADISLEEYSYTEVSDNQFRLDIAYTVEYAGIKAQLAEALAKNLTNDPELDLTDEQADQFASRLEQLTVNEVSANYAVQPANVNAQFQADIDNYDQAVLAFFDLAQAADTESMDAATLQSLDQARAQLEAQSAASLQQQYTWNGEVTKPSSSEVAVSFDADYTTENWDAYVQELNDRGIETSETEYEFTGDLDGENLVFDGQLAVRGSLLDQTLGYLSNASQDDPETARALEAFSEADFTKAKMSASVNESQVVFEAGAQFQDLAALRDALAETDEGIPAGFASAVARPEDGETKTYVRVDGAVSSGASESDVRALAYVDSDTTVNMPGSWDREFPTMDVDRARNYLGLQTGSEDGDTTAENASNNNTGNSTTVTAGPGFTVGLAVLALLASVALLARRD
jgi:PGF-CTERM protein